MADDKFDSIVVGAGPAGVSAAITMAKAGLNVALLERGEYPGAKNVRNMIWEYVYLIYSNIIDYERLIIYMINLPCYLYLRIRVE